ncbi:hypothetical protein Vqi01_58970 [Micromonospora qiuiae]|uniref:Uncharacterized protein n=1 Tax=Micromonospora qiuiae TaxID=502268 RepID=A0ABQ4JMQ0_9ACTN|nr:hypothetical protein [Micromonospora qiuiae]GIJ30735.1 hypothetical protein Vqi01_58970 [Micromonospora qiuiae]
MFFPYVAKRRIEALIKSLQALVASDPEQQVQGFAVPVVSAALDDIKQAVPNDPVVRSLVDLMSADAIGSGDPVRAADMLVIAEQLNAAIGKRPPFVA